MAALVTCGSHLPHNDNPVGSQSLHLFDGMGFVLVSPGPRLLQAEDGPVLA